MKTNELMINDWVMVNDIEHNHPLQVAEIFKKCGAYYVTLYWDGMPDNVNPETLTSDVDKVLPIPLTPEILEKNGFVKFIAGQYLLPAEGNEWVVTIVPNLASAPNSNGTMLIAIKNIYTDAKIAITYVHQLQHALRLCGIDKTIEL